MLGIVLRALRRRRVHATTLFVLGLIAAAAAAAAPGYAIASAENLAASELSSSAAAERLVTVEGDLPPSRALDPGTDDLIVRTIALPGFELVDDLRLDGNVGDVRVSLVYREGVCDRLTLSGRCPSQPGEAALAPDIAQALHAGVGSRLTFGAADLTAPVSVTVVGIYQPTDPADPYWGPSQTAENGTVSGQRFKDGTVFTPRATFEAARVRRVHLTVDLIASPAAVRAENPQYLALAYERAVAPLGSNGLSVTSNFRVYADRTLGETNLVYVGVIAATVQLLILVWFALALAVRQSGQARRPDVALLKLRGVRRRSLWSLVAGQAAVPIVTGGVVGLILGAVGVRWWAGTVVDPQAAALGLVATAGAAAAAILIAVLAALLAERRMLAEPVADLARRVPARHRGWRAGVIDAAVIALAVAAAVELRSGAVATAQFRGLDVLAPALVALAVGVVAAWLVPRGAQVVAAPALRSGRIGTGLAAVQLARRPVLPAVLTMLVLAVAVLTGAAVNWGVTLRAQQERAALEVGADRVLTVRATSSAMLLAAVREADPEGRYAMAVVRTMTGMPTLAVDSSRLAAVVPWSPNYGVPDWSTVARALSAGSADPLTLHTGPLVLDATWHPSGAGRVAEVAAVVERPDGQVTPLPFGRLRPGAATYSATLAGCDPQCRLVGFVLSGHNDLVGSSLTLRQLVASGAAVLTPTEFADRGRWRTSLVPGDELPTLATADAGLALTVGSIQHNTQVITFPVFVRDAPSPLPMYAAGDVEAETLAGVGTVVAPGGPTPADLVGTAAVLPRVGPSGRLVDLAEATRLRPGAGGRLEVWLAPGTPPSVVQALTGHGLSIVNDESLAARLDQLRAQGPPIALRYLLVVALVGFALAVTAFALAVSVERADRADELAALRRQGLRSGTARWAAFAGYASFAVVAVGLGVATALVAEPLIVRTPRVFGDGWRVLPTPHLSPAVLLLIGGGALVVTVAVALAAGAALIRAVRAGGSTR